MIADILLGCTVLLIALAFVPGPKPKWVLWSGNTICVAIVGIVTYWGLQLGGIV